MTQRNSDERKAMLKMRRDWQRFRPSTYDWSRKATKNNDPEYRKN